MPGFPVKFLETREFTGGYLLTQCLKRLGVTDISGLKWGERFSHGPRVRRYQTHERVAVGAADGSATVSGNLLHYTKQRVGMKCLRSAT